MRALATSVVTAPAVGFVIVVIVVVSGLAAGTARAQASALDACRSPDQVLSGLAFPVDGADGVPTNVTPFVGASGALELLLVGDDGNEIPSQIEAIAVGNAIGATGTIKRIVPAGELNPGQNITVVADGTAVTHFTIGGASDDDAPGAPDVDVGSSCDTQGGTSLTVGVANDDAVLFIGVVDGQPVIGGGARVDGVASQNDKLTVFGTGSAEVNVAGVDLAGNVGASTPVKVDFPEVPGFSCASSTASSSSPLWLALVLGAMLRLGAVLRLSAWRARSTAATSLRRPR